jgi:hypothetical protein
VEAGVRVFLLQRQQFAGHVVLGMGGGQQHAGVITTVLAPSAMASATAWSMVGVANSRKPW